VARHPRQIGSRHAARIGVPVVLVVNGFTATDGRLDFVQTKNAPNRAGTVGETPGGFFLGRQDNFSHPAAAVQFHFITRQRGCARTVVGAQQQFDLRVVGAIDPQQLALGITDRLQALAATEGGVSQMDAVTAGGEDLAGQRHSVLTAAAKREHFDQSGLVHHAVGAVLIVVKMEAVEFLFPDRRFAATAGNLEGLPGAQGEDAVVRGELAQIEVPAKTKTGINYIDRIKTQPEHKVRAA
jgi:hypothetical protein